MLELRPGAAKWSCLLGLGSTRVSRGGTSPPAAGSRGPGGLCLQRTGEPSSRGPGSPAPEDRGAQIQRTREFSFRGPGSPVPEDQGAQLQRTGEPRAVRSEPYEVRGRATLDTRGGQLGRGYLRILFALQLGSIRREP